VRGRPARDRRVLGPPGPRCPGPHTPPTGAPQTGRQSTHPVESQG
jgi:hypothetical protein